MTSDTLAQASSLDDLFLLIGLGKWNFGYFIVAGLSVAVGPVNLIGAEFMAAPANFTCADPVGPSADLQTDSQCSVLVAGNNGSVEEVNCRSFLYDRSTFENTVTMEFNMVCSHAWYRQLFQLSLTFGCLLGPPLGGILSDRYGRQPTLWGCSLAVMVATVLLAAVPVMWVVMVARFTQGAGSFAFHIASFTMGLEVCPLKHRSTYGMVAAFPFALMVTTVAGISYLLRSWRGILLLGSLPLALLTFFSNPLLLQESPRWLLSCGRVTEARHVFERGARLNGTEHKLPKDLDEFLLNIRKEQVLSSSNNQLSFLERLRSMVSTPEMRRITICSMVLLFIHGTLFMSIPLRADAFSSSFLYVALLGMGETPAYTLTAPIINRVGRKPFIITCFTIITSLEVTLATLTAMEVDNNALLLTLSVIAYFVVTSGYQGNNMYCTELFPTTVRALGFSLAYFMCNVGYNVPPILDLLLPSNMPWLALAIYAALGPVGVLLIALLPETNQKPLQQSVNETSLLQGGATNSTGEK